ncbi:hypothetical protein evm_004932 [Chilo suppressalis]|nr:hypothetical protein evm_004932 [Chilo suppressalis]
MASTSGILDPQPGPSQPRSSTSDASEDLDPQPGPSQSRSPTSDDQPYVDRHLYVEEIISMWNLSKIVRELGNRDQCVAFAEAQGLMPTEKLCRTTHRTPMLIAASTNCLATVADWYNYCRESVVIYQLEKTESRELIGGPGKIVQLDESKFGKRKYNRGRHIEGHWVLGMIEDGSEDLRLEVCPDNIRSAEVLVPLIKKHVKPGTTIHTDYWRAYDCLGQHGFIHKKVNHSDPDNPFIAPDGTHTQRIARPSGGLSKDISEKIIITIRTILQIRL